MIQRVFIRSNKECITIVASAILSRRSFCVVFATWGISWQFPSCGTIMTLTPAGDAIKSPSSYRGIVSTSCTRRIIAIFFPAPLFYPASVKIRRGTTFAYTSRQFPSKVCTQSIRKKGDRTYGTLNRDGAVKSKFSASFTTSYKRTVTGYQEFESSDYSRAGMSHLGSLKIQPERWHLNLLKVRSLRGERLPNRQLRTVHIAKPSVVSEAKSSSLPFL